MAVAAPIRTPRIIGPQEIDYSFAEDILREPGGEHLFECSACGTCAATCLIRRYDASFNPRILMRKATLGLRDVVLWSPEVWECSACDKCYGRCPRRIRISDVMGAIRAIAIREGYERPGEVASVNVARCAACGMCGAACPYGAISLQEVLWGRRTLTAAQVDATACMGCGICAAVCPSGSIGVPGQTDTQVHDDLTHRGLASSSPAADHWGGKVLVLACSWCTHTTADARAAAAQYTGAEIVRVACAGRVSPLMVTAALQMGAGAVLTVGCSEGECHYRRGADLQRGRMGMLGSLLGMLGMAPERVRFRRMGSLDRGRFAQLVEGAVRDAAGVSIPVGAQGGV